MDILLCVKSASGRQQCCAYFSVPIFLPIELGFDIHDILVANTELQFWWPEWLHNWGVHYCVFHVTNLYESTRSLRPLLIIQLMLLLQFDVIIILYISPVEWVEGSKNPIRSIIFNVKISNWIHKCVCVNAWLHIYMWQ